MMLKTRTYAGCREVSCTRAVLLPVAVSAAECRVLTAN